MNNEEEKYNLTIQQENIWLVEKLNENTNINNITGIFEIKKLLKLDIMKLVMNKIIENNDALRIHINEVDGAPVQFVKPYEFEEIPIYKVSTSKEANQIIDTIRLKRFDVTNDSLHYIAVIQDSDTTYVCVKTHHIISDAWTLGQVAEQIKENYIAISNKQVTLVQPSYLQYIKNDEEYRISEKYLKDKEFWKEYVKDIVPISNFKNSENIQSNRIERKIPSTLFKKISEYCKENRISEYGFFLTTISIYFMKLFGQESIVIGTPFLNRRKINQELEMMGMFIATLPIKISIPDNKITFTELCKEVANTTMSCFKHSRYPYTEIQKEYQNTTKSNMNLYELAFSYQINKLEKEIDGDTGKTIWLQNGTQFNPMLISYVNHFGEHKFYYDYLLELFTHKEIDNINERIIKMIKTIISVNNISIADVNILSDEDETLLKQFNNTGNTRKNEETIISRFETIAKQHSDNTALKCGDKEITYKELNKKMNSVASNLQKLGVREAVPVSIIFDKSIDMIIAMLGIMKAGGYYIPILPEEEQKRAEYIVQNSDSKIILTSSGYMNKIVKKDIKVLDISELIDNKSHNVKPTAPQIAYLIYTSGTTGFPKGVIMMHKNIVSLITSINKDKDLKFVNKDISISLLKYSFDASAIDIYTSLLNGGKLILVPKEIELNPKEVTEIIENEKVTRCSTVHKWIEQIQNYQHSKNIKLRVLGTGAEVLKPKKFKKILNSNKKLGLYNTYGPTETTMFVTKHKIDENDIKKNISPIGKLIPNVRAVVVNNKNEILPINAKGELVIYEDSKSAENISLGYYKLDEKTKEKFINLKLPFLKKPVKAYKTGDVVKINNNLELEFFGRQDDFVKVNGGYLVSLNEVEKTIQNITDNKIEICAIAVPNKGTNQIILFIVENSETENIKIEDIENIISENLTFYMRPKRIISITEIPRNKNGKVDKEKLRKFAIKKLELKTEMLAPRSELEKFIYSKIKNIINTDFSITDDFEDDLGLDSLNITSLYIELANDKLAIQDLYNYSTVQDLANMMSKENTKANTQNYDEEIQIFNNSKKMDLSNVLLTGVTGFLGANLLKELANNSETERIYCLIRSKITQTSDERFEETLNRYFSKEERAKIKQKTIVVNGDLSKEKFGMNENAFLKMLQPIKTIINSAANVKHIGKYRDFYKDNVTTVNNIIEIAEKYKIGFVHISTLSLNGFRTNKLVQNEIFDENTLYIGQTFNKSPYLISKYEAERNILSAIKEKNINAKIFRVGNIMPRVSDGMFQKNYNQNAFMLALSEILKLKIQNVEMLNSDIYLTPVDECCKAILTILNTNSSNTIYHIESNKPVKAIDIVNIMKEQEKKFKIADLPNLSDELYKNYNIGVEHLKTIIYNNSNKYSKNITIKLLEKNDFKWSKLNEKYLENIINIAKKI